MLIGIPYDDIIYHIGDLGVAFAAIHSGDRGGRRKTSPQAFGCGWRGHGDCGIHFVTNEVGPKAAETNSGAR
jgi:hypothetical protein